jgi:hypothetical protein
MIDGAAEATLSAHYDHKVAIRKRKSAPPQDAAIVHPGQNTVC